MANSKKQKDSIIAPVPSIECCDCGASVDLSGAELFSVMPCPGCGVELRVPGTMVGLFVLKEIGRGSTGAVYKAFDQTLQQQVALKVMHKQLGKDRRHVDTFLGEARALHGLNHPNVVAILSYGRENERPYVVMELIHGNRMEDLMDQRKSMGEIRLLEIAVDVVKGLQAANKIGVRHGDIKPENILIDDRGIAKVVDFGLARAFHEDDDEVWGTPYFIAPERARKDKEDHRADIYSLGATLFDALAGRPPFEGTGVTEVVEARLKGPAPSLLEFRKNINPETAETIARMLEMDPNRRQPDYRILLADLYAVLSTALRGPKIITPTL